jgi:hypothetical protein
MVDTQMNTIPFRNSHPEKCKSYIDKGIDVRHSYESKTDSLSAVRIDLMMVVMEI